MGTRPPGAEDGAREGAPGPEEGAREAVPVLRCRACGHRVADQKDAVAVGGEPVVRSFVNPHGFVHEVLTLSHAAGMRHGGPRVDADSWFPGYAWQIGGCAGCGSHLGWHYTARLDAVPRSFVGLRKAAVREAEG